MALIGNFFPCLQTAAKIKAKNAIMGINLRTSIVEGSIAKDLKGLPNETGSTSYELARALRSTFICH